VLAGSGKFGRDTKVKFINSTSISSRVGTSTSNNSLVDGSGTVVAASVVVALSLVVTTVVAAGVLLDSEPLPAESLVVGVGAAVVVIAGDEDELDSSVITRGGVVVGSEEETDGEVAIVVDATVVLLDSWPLPDCSVVVAVGAMVVSSSTYSQSGRVGPAVVVAVVVLVVVGAKMHVGGEPSSFTDRAK
jgi:hypothetical protein